MQNMPIMISWKILCQQYENQFLKKDIMWRRIVNSNCNPARYRLCKNKTISAYLYYLSGHYTGINDVFANYVFCSEIKWWNITFIMNIADEAGKKEMRVIYTYCLIWQIKFDTWKKTYLSMNDLLIRNG